MRLNPESNTMPTADHPGVLTFPGLANLAGIQHAFFARNPEIPGCLEKDLAMAALRPWHEELCRQILPPARPLITAEQVHGSGVAVLPHNQTLPTHPIPGVDALVTDRTDCILGIAVADCAAVYFVDRRSGAIGLAHSGKKGTEAKIAAKTVLAMQTAFGSRPADLFAQISPAIRPPAYEVDFCSSIREQLHLLGVEFDDCGTCTSADPANFYSYRREKGNTGRMLAVLARHP